MSLLYQIAFAGLDKEIAENKDTLLTVYKDAELPNVQPKYLDHPLVVSFSIAHKARSESVV